MIADSVLKALFVILALLIEALLIAHFAALRWRPALDARYGWLVYALGLPSLGLGIALAARGLPWYIAAGPLLYCVWSVLGYAVDIWRPVEWRRPPCWIVFVPYVALYVAGLLFYWVPLWFIHPAYWVICGAMYVVHTALNIRGHFGAGYGPTACRRDRTAAYRAPYNHSQATWSRRMPPRLADSRAASRCGTLQSSSLAGAAYVAPVSR